MSGEVKEEAMDAASEEKTAVCRVCMHRCRLQEGQRGACRARINLDGVIRPENYGRLTALNLDPIEKKPLKRFRPGSMILSLGSYGCSLRCPFCQNHDIAQSDGTGLPVHEFTPAEITEIAKRAIPDGNIGVAYTYNEMLVSYEFVRDTGRLVREAGMSNVLVTNGEASLQILDELLPFMDAMNIDLKGFTDEIYRRLGGDLDMVKSFIKTAASSCHVEITSLIVPGMNDSLEDMEREAGWIASVSPGIPLHITRYFPNYRMSEPPTDIGLMRKLKDIAQRELEYVYLGNV